MFYAIQLFIVSALHLLKVTSLENTDCSGATVKSTLGGYAALSKKYKGYRIIGHEEAWYLDHLRFYSDEDCSKLIPHESGTIIDSGHFGNDLWIPDHSFEGIFGDYVHWVGSPDENGDVFIGLQHLSESHHLRCVKFTHDTLGAQYLVPRLRVQAWDEVKDSWFDLYGFDCVGENDIELSWADPVKEPWCKGYISGASNLDNSYEWNTAPKPICERGLWEERLSCCSPLGLESITKNFLDMASQYAQDGSNSISPTCMAQAEAFSTIICSPNQGTYIESGSIRVCYSTCEKLFQACGMPGEIFPAYADYTDPTKLCKEFWSGFGKGYPQGSDFGDPCTIDHHDFACKTGILDVEVVHNSSDCLDIMTETDGENPLTCNEDASMSNRSAIIGAVVGSIVGCICIAFGVYYCFYRANAEKSWLAESSVGNPQSFPVPVPVPVPATPIAPVRSPVPHQNTTSTVEVIVNDDGHNGDFNVQPTAPEMDI